MPLFFFLYGNSARQPFAKYLRFRGTLDLPFFRAHLSCESSPYLYRIRPVVRKPTELVGAAFAFFFRINEYGRFSFVTASFSTRQSIPSLSNKNRDSATFPKKKIWHFYASALFFQLCNSIKEQWTLSPGILVILTMNSFFRRRKPDSRASAEPRNAKIQSWIFPRQNQ